MCCYCDIIMRVRDIDSSDILLDEKWYENILIYKISSKTFMSAKALRIRFDKIDGFIKIYSGIIYLEIFDYWFMMKFIIRLDIGGKSDVTDSINHNFAKIRI